MMVQRQLLQPPKLLLKTLAMQPPMLAWMQMRLASVPLLPQQMSLQKQPLPLKLRKPRPKTDRRPDWQFGWAGARLLPILFRREMR